MPAGGVDEASCMKRNQVTILSTSSLLNRSAGAVGKRGFHDATRSWSKSLTVLSRSGRDALLLKITYVF